MFGRLNQADRMLRAPADDAVALLQAVRRPDRRWSGRWRCRRQHRDLDHALIGHDHRTIGQHVRADRRDAERRDGGKHDGSAGRQRIGGGPGGRRDDQSVGLVDAHEADRRRALPGRSCARFRPSPARCRSALRRRQCACPPRHSSVCSMRRRLDRDSSPRSARSSCGYSSSTVIAVRNPRPPRFTANSGMSRPPAGARRREQRAIAAQHDQQLRALRRPRRAGVPSVRGPA